VGGNEALGHARHLAGSTSPANRHRPDRSRGSNLDSPLFIGFAFRSPNPKVGIAVTVERSHGWFGVTVRRRLPRRVIPLFSPRAGDRE